MQFSQMQDSCYGIYDIQDPYGENAIWCLRGWVDRVTKNKMDGEDIGRGRERKKHRVRMCDRKGAKKRAG